MKMIAICTLITTLFVACKSQSPTEFLCKRLKPQEDTSYFARGTGPYSMTLAKKDGYVEVKIEAKEGSHFQGNLYFQLNAFFFDGYIFLFSFLGFNVEARQDGAIEEPFGEFRDQPDLSFTECSKIPKSLASQKDKSKKTSVTLKWNIPGNV